MLLKVGGVWMSTGSQDRRYNSEARQADYMNRRAKERMRVETFDDVIEELKDIHPSEDTIARRDAIVAKSNQPYIIRDQQRAEFERILTLFRFGRKEQ